MRGFSGKLNSALLTFISLGSSHKPIIYESPLPTFAQCIGLPLFIEIALNKIDVIEKVNVSPPAARAIAARLRQQEAKPGFC